MSGKKAVKRYTRHALHNALILGAAGIHVFPIGLRPEHKTEHGWKLGKIYYKGLRWSEAATTKPKRIRKLWAEYPDSAVGIATGPSHLGVIDRDDLAVDLGQLPETFAYPTPRGGQHRLHRTPEGLQIKSNQPITDIDGKEYEGVDRKAHGGMVVFYLDRKMTADDAAALQRIAPLPDRWLVTRDAPAADASGITTTADEWIDTRDGAPDYSEALAELVEAIPTAGLSNGDMNAFFGPLVRAAWSAPGGRQAVLDGIDRYADGYGGKYRRAALHSIQTVVRDHQAELDSRITFQAPKRPAAAPAKTTKAPKPKTGKAKAKTRRAKSKTVKHEEYEPTGDAGTVSPPTKPLDVAHELLGGEVLPPIRYRRETWLTYREGHWSTTTPAEVENMLYAALRSSVWVKLDGKAPVDIDWAPTTTKIRETMRAIQSLVTITEDRPHWIDGRSTTTALVPVRDGLLEPVTGKIRPRSQHFLSTTFVDAELRTKAPHPEAWHAFLDQLWPGDQASKALLQEWMGYLISGDTRRHKGMMMVGPKRSGKGTILSICEALVGGESGATATSVPGLSESFGLERFEGRSLITVGDLRGSGREAASAAQKLLEIIGGDSVYINRKGRPATTAKIGARVMIASNSMPRLYDDAGVIESRFLLLRFTETFAGREDLELQEKLIAELSGIVRWALKGYRRLEAAGAFTVPETDAEDRAQLRANAAPITEFLEDMCVTTDELGTPRAEMWNAYMTWCNESGAGMMDQAAFGASMAGAGYPPHRPAGKDRTARGKWRYRGIRLRHEETAQEKARRLWPGVGEIVSPAP